MYSLSKEDQLIPQLNLFPVRRRPRRFSVDIVRNRPGALVHKGYPTTTEYDKNVACIGPSTKVPGKWRLVDTETGEVYGWRPDGSLYRLRRS